MDLFKLNANMWVVKTADIEPNKFISIEAACTFLEDNGIIDEEIDFALATMTGNGHTRAVFGLNGHFIYSDDSQFHELSGTA